MRVRRGRVLGPRAAPSIPAHSRRGSSAVDGQRVAQGRDFGPDGNARDRRRGRARRGRGAPARRRARRRDVRRPLGRREAVHAPPGGAVHDLDAAAGGEPQAPLLRADDDARRPAPLRERLHHLHAHRLDDAVGDGARRRRARRLPSSTGADSVPERPRRYDAQGQERAGGARGDPARRRLLPDAEAGRRASCPRRARALRADLEADDRVADGGRARARRSRSGSARRRRPGETPSSAPPAP